MLDNEIQAVLFLTVIPQDVIHVVGDKYDYMAAITPFYFISKGEPLCGAVGFNIQQKDCWEYQVIAMRQNIAAYPGRKQNMYFFTPCGKFPIVAFNHSDERRSGLLNIFKNYQVHNDLFTVKIIDVIVIATVSKQSVL